LADLAPDC